MNTANYTNLIQPLSVKVTGDLAHYKFNPFALRELGFKDNGAAWSNSNEPLYTLDTQIGALCVVAFKRVYLIHGNKEEHLERISDTQMLTQFIQMLS